MYVHVFSNYSKVVKNPSSIKAFVSQELFSKGRTVVIKDVRFKVVSSYKIVVTYYPRRNIISFSKGDYRIQGKAAVQRFLDDLGGCSVSDFVRSFFKEVNYFGNCATSSLYCNELTEDKMFS